jgi:hypothetical protein
MTRATRPTAGRTVIASCGAARMMPLTAARPCAPERARTHSGNVGQRNVCDARRSATVGRSEEKATLRAGLCGLQRSGAALSIGCRCRDEEARMASELSALQQAAAAAGELQDSPVELAAQPTRCNAQHAASHCGCATIVQHCASHWLYFWQLTHSAPRSRSMRRRCALHW